MGPLTAGFATYNNKSRQLRCGQCILKAQQCESANSNRPIPQPLLMGSAFFVKTLPWIGIHWMFDPVFHRRTVSQRIRHVSGREAGSGLKGGDSLLQQHHLDGLGEVRRHQAGDVDTDKDVTGIASGKPWKHEMPQLVFSPKCSIGSEDGQREFNQTSKMDSIVSVFQAHFPGKPRVFRAPGRVNIIGEHTDNYDGYVFPMAIDKYTAVAIAPREDGLPLLQVWSENMQELVTLSLEKLKRMGHWSDYVAGVASEIGKKDIKLRGANVCILSELPIGGGLSSSAALEISTAMALLSLVGVSLDKAALTRLGRRAETQFVGVNCGVMDQFVTIYGEKNKALFLDCRTLEYELVPLPVGNAKIVVCNTMMRHELAASEYNNRRAECLAGTRLLKEIYPHVQALRDVSLEMFGKVQDKLPETIRNRCRHVISENERVRESVDLLKADRLERFGRLMNASHVSLRDDFQVSCDELDTMVDIARSLPGVIGARMTGGGFGGCTVNLVEADKVEAFSDQVASRYQQAAGIQPAIYITDSVDGAHDVGALA